MSVNELVSSPVAERRPSRFDADRPRPRYASLLVHVETPSTASDGRIALSVDLARRFGATLVGMAAEALQPPPVDVYGGVAFVGAGHHATERYGIGALGIHLAGRFGLSHRFIDISNPV